MKVDLKVSKRDAVLLGVLAFALLLYLGGWWLLRPAYEQVEANTALLEEKEMQAMLISNRIAELPALDAGLEKAEELLAEQAQDLRPLLTNDQLDDLVTGMLLSHNLTAKRLVIREAELDVIEPYYASKLAFVEKEMKAAAEAAEEAGTAAENGEAAEAGADAAAQGGVETTVEPVEEDPLMAGMTEAAGGAELVQKALLKELPQSVYTAELVECQAVGSREDVQRFIDSFSDEPAIRPIRFEIKSLDSLMQQLGSDMLTGAQGDSANAEVDISLAVYMFDGVQTAASEEEAG